MMPFVSQAQARAAFGGYLGPEMKKKAAEFAAATPSIKKLPNHVRGAVRKRKLPAIPNVS